MTAIEPAHRYSTISGDPSPPLPTRALTVTPLSSEVSNYCSTDVKKICSTDIKKSANDHKDPTSNDMRPQISLKESSLI